MQREANVHHLPYTATRVGWIFQTTANTTFANCDATLGRGGLGRRRSERVKNTGQMFVETVPSQKRYTNRIAIARKGGDKKGHNTTQPNRHILTDKAAFE
jgi:hypothetical protein